MPVKKKIKKIKTVARTIDCPCCGLDRPEPPEGEPMFECVNCGSEGFDCCIAGNNVKCFQCEEREDDEFHDTVTRS